MFVRMMMMKRRKATFKHMFLKQEQLREERTRHVRELNKQIKERERNLEQKQREDEEQVKNTAQENLEIKQEQEKELEGT